MSSKNDKIFVGVSACVLGQEVRFNGGHKRNSFVTDQLGPHVEFVSVCPEVEMGLSVPRETLRLIGKSESPRLVTSKGERDHTDAMLRFARQKVEELAEKKLCGFIVQKNSPSCGMERVRVYPPRKDGEHYPSPNKNGRGLFTQVLMERFPDLPVEEDGRLNDPLLREHFIMRVLAYKRLRDLLDGDWQARDLVEFHSREKFLILAHADYAPLGRLVAHRGDRSQEEWGREYGQLYLRALARTPSRGKHVNVLQHIAGYFREGRKRAGLDHDSRLEVSKLISAYQDKLVPLAVPLTLLRHHVRHLSLSYLESQSYLHPAPMRLLPQNHL